MPKTNNSFNTNDSKTLYLNNAAYSNSVKDILLSGNELEFNPSAFDMENEMNGTESTNTLIQYWHSVYDTTRNYKLLLENGVNPSLNNLQKSVNKTNVNAALALRVLNAGNNTNSGPSIKQTNSSDDSLPVPDWIKDVLGDDWRQYFEVTDDGFFICTVPMDQLFAKAGLTDEMQSTVNNWYLIGVYDPEKNPPEVAYGAVVINRVGSKGVEGSSLPFTTIDMDLLEKTIEKYKNGEPLDVESIFVSIAPVYLCDDEEKYYKNPNKKMYKYFCDAGKDGSILIADLIVQDNLDRYFSPHLSGGTTFDGVFPYKYDNYCSQSRDAIDSLIEKGICAKDPDTGTITMTIQDPDNLSMDEYNALLMMTTDDPDIYAYIAENNAHAAACKVGYDLHSSSQSDCWPGENGKAEDGGSSSGSESSYKDKDGRYYIKAVKKHEDQFTN